MSGQLWKVGVPWKERRPEGTIRHSQVVTTYGPGALVDFVDDAAIIAGLSWWAKGPEIVEDRLVAMLARQEGFGGLQLFSPPVGGARDLEDATRKWIKAFRFPEWFVCQNERCWDDAEQPQRRDGAHPRRLLRINQLDGSGHKCKGGGKGKASKVQPIRFTRSCKFGHIDDIAWFDLVHRKNPGCRRMILWLDEAGASGDLQDVRVSCSGCGANVRMSLATQIYTEGHPTLGACEGKRPWLGDDQGDGCGQPMRLLLRSATHAYFSVSASVIHIPDAGAHVRDQVSKAYELVKNVKAAAQLEMLRELQPIVRNLLDGLSDEEILGEIARRREGKSIDRKKLKEAEAEVLQSLPHELTTDRPGGRFFGRTLKLPATRSKLMEPVDRVVLLHRLTEVRALVGFTRFEPKSTDVDGEVDIGAEVARLDDPLTWLPAVENLGEGFFFSFKESALAAWEGRAAVRERAELFRQGFELWKAQRKDRATAKPDFIPPRFVLLHSLSHLLITAVSLDCGYSASSIRERIYASVGGSGILLYTASSGAEGSLGGLVEVGRRLERYLEHALDLGRLCSNDPVCAAHAPAHEIGASDRHLEGASCHGCLLISEPSCERMNQYLDRTLVVPTVETSDAAFFRGG